MNKQKEFLPFKEISDKYLSLKKSISNKDLQNLYMKFNFWKLDQIDDAKSEDCLNNFLKENMFFCLYQNSSYSKSRIRFC